LERFLAWTFGYLDEQNGRYQPEGFCNFGMISQDVAGTLHERNPLLNRRARKADGSTNRSRTHATILSEEGEDAFVGSVDIHANSID
jgi:hypothetical protein